MQLYPPLVLLQMALAPHLWVFMAHSSMSTKTVCYQSMAILIRGKTREIHGWYLLRKTKIQKTQVENGHTPAFLNSEFDPQLRGHDILNVK